jgi:hypothetical protein
MGAWGTGAFENDDALDWLSVFIGRGGQSQDVVDICQRIADLTDEEYLEAPDASKAIAAAECLAAVLGNPLPPLPDLLAKWLASQPICPSAEIRTLALQAVRRVRDKSELRDLWEESPQFGDWRKKVLELENRLS